MGNRTKNNKGILNQILIFSLAILAITSIEILSRNFFKAKEKTEIGNERLQTDQPTLRNETPIELTIKRDKQSNINISIRNVAGKDVDLRAFTLEVIANIPLTNLTEKSIERGKDLEKAGFIFPIRKLEKKDKKTFFKLAGILIGQEAKIKNNQEIILASINLDPYLEETVDLGEETKIIDNSGSPLEFVIKKE